uniref:Uncharacterized protein n=1 Tax=Arundo donax TaxID=35708 RepID=A0A0A9CKP7_ARUDO
MPVRQTRALEQRTRGESTHDSDAVLSSLALQKSCVVEHAARGLCLIFKRFMMSRCPRTNCCTAWGHFSATAMSDLYACTARPAWRLHLDATY